MSAKIIDGKAFAANVRARVAEDVVRLKEENGNHPVNNRHVEVEAVHQQVHRCQDQQRGW